MQSVHPTLTPLLGHACCLLLNNLVKKSSEVNVQSSLSVTMCVMLESVVQKRAYLLRLASKADDKFIFTADKQMIYNMISNAIPQRILAKTSKVKIVEHMVEVWNILLILLSLVKLGRAEEHHTHSYLQLLDMTENSCCQELAEADDEDRNAKSIKISPQERERKFMEAVALVTTPVDCLDVPNVGFL